jgi:hypothetical protein
MSTYTKATSRKKQRHPASRDESHRLDKAQGEARRRTTFVPVETPERPSPQRSFGDLTGHEYIHDGPTWRRCEAPEEFADYLEAEAKRRNWFLDKTQRRGVAVEMKRRATALEVVTTTCPPWLSDWLAAQFAQKKNPRPQLSAIRNRWLGAAVKLLSDARAVLGYAFHADTDDPHFDLVLSRQDGVGGRIGQPGLRQVGPWSTSVDRQLRCGAEISAEKRDRMRRGVANFRRRYGEDAKPLDVLLARTLDAAAAVVLGAELTPYREAYAKSVPELERQHAAAQLAVLEAAKKKLLEHTVPQSEPEMSV